MTGSRMMRGLRAALAAATALTAIPALSDEAPSPAGQQQSQNLEQQFQDPPNSARPRVWWHWMNGNITKDGIAKDLAWMKAVGIGGMQNFDANLNTPQIVDKRLKPEKLTLLAQRSGLARLSLNGELVLQSRPPAVRMGRASVEIPIGSFLQATAMAEDVLGALVVEGVGKAKSVADLFCGMGPFSFRLAERAKVYAADSDRAAIEALPAHAKDDE